MTSNRSNSPRDYSQITNLRALCVDTEPLLSEFMSDQLQAHGFITATASSVSEALQIYAQGEPPALLTTCLHGIGGNGLQLGIEIRRMNQNIAMIGYSGFVPSDFPQRLLSAGFDILLELPISITTLHKVVCNALNRRHQDLLADYAAHCFDVFEMTHSKASNT